MVAMFIPLLTLGVPLIELAVTFFRRLMYRKIRCPEADLGHLFLPPPPTEVSVRPRLS